MNIKHGNGKTIYGAGVDINLTSDEVATAIDAYLVAQNIHVSGPRTILINGELIKTGKIYIDPIGSVIYDDKRMSWRGNNTTD